MPTQPTPIFSLALRQQRRPFASALLAFLTFTTVGFSESIRTAPIQNIKIPAYSQAGNRIGLLLGTEAIYVSNSEIHIKNLDLTLYTDDSTARITSTLKAPSAQIHRANNELRAQGSDLIHIRHLDTIELTGRDWTYDHLKQKITINKDVQVTYQASLPELLK